MENIAQKAIQLLDEKHGMMADYTLLSEEMPSNGVLVFKPKKEFAASTELRNCLTAIAKIISEINSLPKEECEAIKRKMAHHERNLKYKK